MRIVPEPQEEQQPATSTSRPIWLDGRFLSADDVHVDLLSHTLHYGLGVFEGIRSYRTEDGGLAIFRLRDHIRRLFDSAKVCQLTIPYPQEEIVGACVELSRRHGDEPAYLRPLVFVGAGRMGLGAMDNPIHTAVACWKWGAYLGEDGLRNGIRAKISSFSRGHVNANMLKAKVVGQYVNSILAKWEAKRSGFDEAILLDVDGYVSEASGENVFAVRNGVLWTPSAAGTILAGLTRDAVLVLARDRGVPAREERFTRDFLWTADEVFLTGTAAEVTPVREIDGRTIGAGGRGPVTEELQAAFFDTVAGRDERHRDWLEPV